MSEIVTHDLNALVRQAEAKANLPAPKNLNRVDVADQERKVTYFKIMELMNGWRRVYNEYVEQAISDPHKAAEAAKALEEVIRSFDRAMNDLGLVISQHQAVIKRLEKLRDGVDSQPWPGLDEEGVVRFRRRRAARIRKRAAEVVRSMNDMQDTAASPAWLKRTWQKLWGQVAFEIDGEDQERFKLLANHTVSGLSRAAAATLKMDSTVVAAFETMQLPVWALEREMLSRYEVLIKTYHPDNKSTGNEEMSKKINAARDALLAFYASGGQPGS